MDINRVTEGIITDINRVIKDTVKDIIKDTIKDIIKDTIIMGIIEDNRPRLVKDCLLLAKGNLITEDIDQEDIIINLDS